MRKFVSAACGLWACGLSAVLAAPLHAQSVQSVPGVVVELYTSQGCSACPSADALLGRLALNPDVIALSLHVDYWDYIGWQDSFANSEFTARQRAYARAVRSKMIYTPQMIVDGVIRAEGNRPAQVGAAIRERIGTPRMVGLSLSREGDVLKIHADTTSANVAAFAAPIRVQLVRYQPEQVVLIEKGENAGLTVPYTNIVTRLEKVAEWDGAAPLDLSVPVEGDQSIAVLLQREGPGEIIAAAQLAPLKADAQNWQHDGMSLSTKGGVDQGAEDQGRVDQGAGTAISVEPLPPSATGLAHTVKP